MIKTLWFAYGACLLIFLIVSTRQDSPEPGHLVASRDLPANRLVGEEDLRFEGSPAYLRKAVREGTAVTASDVGTWPEIAPPKGMLAVVLPLKDSAFGPSTPNAGEKAMLCRSAHGPVQTVPVIAILCDQTREQCSALVAVTPAAAASLVAAQQATPTLSIDRTCK